MFIIEESAYIISSIISPISPSIVLALILLYKNKKIDRII